MKFSGHPIRDVTSVRLSRVDFEAVLVHLHAYVTQPAMLEHVAAMEQAELTRINPERPAMVDVDPETYPICLHSQQLLQLYTPALLRNVKPINTVGDGNCLFRATSLALYGNDSYHTELRARCAALCSRNRTS